MLASGGAGAPYTAGAISSLLSPTFKEATLAVMSKPGEPSTDPNNYRRVSLLELTGKISEIINITYGSNVTWRKITFITLPRTSFGQGGASLQVSSSPEEK